MVARKNVLEDVNVASLVFHAQNVTSTMEMKVLPGFEKIVNISFKLNILDSFLKIVKNENKKQ